MSASEEHSAHTSLERLIRVEIAADRLEASLYLAPNISPDLLIDAYLHMRLDQAGIIRNAERDAGVRWIIREYLDRAAEELRRTVITGTPPQHGVDAKLEIIPPAAGDTANTPSTQDAAANATTDPYARTQVNWVAAGTVVARIIPAKHGRDGVNVLGEAIPANPARAINPRLDDFLQLNANGDIIALRTGKLIHKNNSLRLDNTITITGNVDFSTSNVVFPGNVIIERGVRDCFKVEAKGDITVRDLVDAATLIADGSITLEQGIAAREKGTVTAGRDLAAKYMTNVRATAARDARIIKELNNCELHVGRRLTAPTCCVVRGHITTAMECELGELGCEGGGTTIVTIGESGSLTAIIARLATTQNQLDRRLDHDKKKLDELHSVKSLAASHAEQLTQLQFNFNRSSGSMKNLVKAVTRVSQLIALHTHHQLTVQNKIHPGAQVRMGKWTCEFTKPLVGPVRISTDGESMPVIKNLLTGAETPANKLARVHSQSAEESIRTLTRKLGLDFDAIATVAAAMRAA